MTKLNFNSLLIIFCGILLNMNAQSSSCPTLTITSIPFGSGGAMQLNAGNNYTSYSWSPAAGLSNPSISNPVASPVTTTVYTVSASSYTDLVVNGDFSGGNTGFSSSMNFSSTVYTPCNYCVGSTWFGMYPSLTDHTATTDNMYMAIDGCTSQAVLWEQTFTNLQPNTLYDFSFWASRADQVQPIFEIHFIDNSGDNIVATITGIPYTGIWTWDQYGAPAWNSGSNSVVTIQIINLETNSYGNDFALDDIAFVNQCSATDTVVVSTGSPCNLNASINQFSSPICNGGSDGSASVSVVPFVSNLSYNWQPVGGNSNVASNLPAGSYTVTVTDSAGCSDSAIVTITDRPLSVDFGTPGFVSASANTAIYFYDESEGAVAWSWSTGDTIFSNLQNTTYTFSDPGEYLVTLTVVFDNGCIESLTHSILVENEFTFYAPESFTPNGDDINDTFLPMGIGWDLNKYELFIFDRWGEEIFHTKYAHQGWNAKVKDGNNEVQEDVYVWTVKLREENGTPHKFIGHVTLVK